MDTGTRETKLSHRDTVAVSTLKEGTFEIVFIGTKMQNTVDIQK